MTSTRAQAVDLQLHHEHRQQPKSNQQCYVVFLDLLRTALIKSRILACLLSGTWGWSSRSNAIICWFRDVALGNVKQSTNLLGTRGQTL
jgi:hypothetical protein